LTSVVSPKEIITTARLFIRAGGILFMLDWKNERVKKRFNIS